MGIQNAYLSPVSITNLSFNRQAQTQVDTRTQMYAGRCIGTQDQQGQGQDLNGTMQSIDHRPTLWITMPTPDMSNSQCCSSASVSNFIPFPGSRDNDIAYRNSSTIQPDPKLNLNPPQPSNLKSISPYSTIPKNNINTGTESRHALGASRTPAFKRCTLHGDTIIDPGAANPTSTTDGSGYQAKRRSLPTHASINVSESATPPANAANPISDPSQDSPSAAFQVSDQLLPIPACKHRSERRLTWTKVLRALMPKKRFSFNNGPPAGEVSGIISTASTDLRPTRRMTAPGSMARSVPALGPGPISASVTSSARPAPGDIEIDTSSSSKPKRLLKSAGHRSAPPAPRVAFASLLL
ncbi:hypothetical protein BJ138DRAFT_363889 [Hygrophoropsis aurantiaca]|uniref:Uncharacterized protein n=1 Tax=Hygrophoropsis aurantiaca TaxID=72124 RepID=A0ACB8ANE1_9AGAM|nr:hypothetical protein BJ138DRAFT_363889 [Hygrophoropsis aurantiaca]